MPPDLDRHEGEVEDVWTDWREVFGERPRLPGLPAMKTIEDVQQAITDLRTVLAEAPIKLGDPDTAAAGRAPNRPTTSETTTANEDRRIDGSIAALEQQVADVDDVYATAREFAARHGETPEWARIRSVHAAVRNLWETIKATAGSYLAEFTSDVRLHGLLTTLFTRAATTIELLSLNLATRLENVTPNTPTTTPKSTVTGVVGELREAFTRARSTVGATATSYEWNRIHAVWGTVNTLSRRAADPGIRDVTARSADAMSGLANTLADKMEADIRRGTAAQIALRELSQAAERHAAHLREPTSARQPASAINAPQAPTSIARGFHGPTSSTADQAAIKAAAIQVAQRAQARISRKPGAALRQTDRTAGQATGPTDSPLNHSSAPSGNDVKPTWGPR